MISNPPPKLHTISVVTPSFNQGAFLAKTISSVVSQEGDFYLDYIVIDGGSSDQSVRIIQQYEADLKKYERCRGIRYRWLSEPDDGQTDALLKGFRMAEGDIVAWLNSDDTYYPGALRKVLACFDEHPEASLVYGKAVFTDTGDAVIAEVETGATDHQGLAMLNLVCQPAAFIQRSAWDASGGLLRHLHFAMDHDLWIRVSRKFKMTYLPEVLATYRLHDQSKTVAARHAVDFQREILETVRGHYGWAPANRVYGYCHAVLRQKLSARPSWVGHLLAFPAVLYALFTYLAMNKGVIRREDLRLLNGSTLKKLFPGFFSRRSRRQS